MFCVLVFVGVCVLVLVCRCLSRCSSFVLVCVGV